LLAAARAEFALRGYLGARIRSITDAAGVTAPVLYHHFGSKAGLYVAVTEQVNDIVLAAFDEHARDRVALTDRIEGLLDAAVAVHADDPSLAELVIAAPVDFARNPELAPLRPQMLRLRNYITDLLVDAPRRWPGLGDADCRRRARPRLRAQPPRGNLRTKRLPPCRQRRARPPARQASITSGSTRPNSNRWAALLIC
jgi:AcrR family transcriptional regulator